MNYEDLRRYQRMERNASNLSELDSGFYTKLGLLINEYKTKYEQSHSIEDAKVLENIQRVALDIFERREMKILSKALKSAKSGLKEERLVELEQSLFDDSICLIKKNRVVFDKALVGNGVGFKKEVLEEKIDTIEGKSCQSEDLNMLLVRILQNVPKFVSSESEELGPFEANQIVRLPHSEATLLVDKNFAELV